MSHYKLLSVVGARPQFIKLAAMHRAIAKIPTLKHVIVHSGQHYDFEMSDRFFEELTIPKPNYNLEIGSDHPVLQMAKCMTGLVDVFVKEKPDIILVYGDTNTTAAAAIAAAKCNFKTAHIEAGLREWDKSIPEEVNKLLTDAVTDLYFTPTETGKINLEKEGKTQNVFVTGDISLDLLYDYTPESKISVPEEPYIFMTCHRAVNTDNPQNLKQILLAAEAIAKPVIFALHPRTKKVIETHFSDWHADNVTIIDPPGFWDTQTYIKHAEFVLTDSGGIIKEAYFHKVPAVILDKQTEWVETVQEGWNVIAGPDKNAILRAVHNWKRPDYHSNCLGDGKAGMRIVEQIIQYLEKLNINK
ncbi:MAG: UDP-N-acetylglucosamine 2-epimerase (non-hydrolyzing) [Saprospiraceae bacterium]|nr:UDP-N-acetylglucosamine 2-epimerase (non-hydrolyzing) [Saprospiraceae bacterium]